MARGTRGSGAKNRGNNNLSRKELIKKHGLSSFREDPVENRELQKIQILILLNNMVL